MLIDFSSRPPVPELEGRAPHLTNYRRVYRNSEAAAEEATGGEDALATYLKTYDRLGAKAVVLKARDLSSTFGFRIANEDVAAFCRRNGERYIGFAGVDPHRGMDAVRELEAAVGDLGMRGLNIQGFEHQVQIDDRILYPLYSKCIELNIPVNVHCGTNFSTATDMGFGHPAALDRVLRHFPELRVCASPPGWPWVNELIGVAWRHPNLWIGLVAVKPKLLQTPHSGYEPLLQYGRTLLKDRIIFGSAYPMMPVQDAVDQISDLPLPDAVREDWLGRNAEAFLRL